jgi:protein-disulfide isomerase
MAILRVPVNSNDHIQGPDNAPVTLLEYGDYECPYCGRTNPVVRRVQLYFGPRLRFAYRHFPLTEIHEHSEAAAETAEYAGAYGRFWEAHDVLFENQDRLGLPLLFAVVRSLGLSEQGLRDALAHGTFADKVRHDFLSGVRSGVNGTPTFFINNRRYDGPPDYEPLDGYDRRSIGIRADAGLRAACEYFLKPPALRRRRISLAIIVVNW